MSTLIEVFKSEWRMRESLLKLEGLSQAEIEREKKIMLARYRLKEVERKTNAE